MSGYYPEGSMKGSGIYSEDITTEVECAECGKTWEEDFQTDDWGNVDAEIVCECGQDFTFTLRQEEVTGAGEPDTLEELYGD
jgi:hypothetical protein